MDRRLNFLFTFLLVVVFISAADTYEQWSVLIGFVFACLISSLSFFLRRLTLDGMVAAVVVGTYIFGLGGIEAAVVVLLFFISSAAISGSWKAGALDLPSEARRDGLQVWANGFWFVSCLILYVTADQDIFMVGAIAAIAAATADTWATEWGIRSTEKVFLITNLQPIEAGTDGGISWQGTGAGLAGSTLIAAVAGFLMDFPVTTILCIFMAGFSGCLLDSYLGAVFQRQNRSITIPALQQDFLISIDNNLVNGIATGGGALMAIILKLVLT